MGEGEAKVISGEVKLEVKNLEKTYDNGVQALKGVSQKVYKGEFLAVIGLSGSGKSTFLRCINRLNDPTAGEIWFEGEDIAFTKGSQVSKTRTKIAMIFQKFNLVGRHTVLSNVLMGSLARTSLLASMFGLFSTDEKEKAMKYLNLVGLKEKAEVRADQLSGGQQQRVAIARALMQEPDVLLADEPVASLDPALCHTVMDYLKKINRELGITVLCNLHHLDLVQDYSDRVVALKDGKKVFEGLSSEIDDNWFKEIYGEEARRVH